jgi:hypothetical protein
MSRIVNWKLPPHLITILSLTGLASASQPAVVSLLSHPVYRLLSQLPYRLVIPFELLAGGGLREKGERGDRRRMAKGEGDREEHG